MILPPRRDGPRQQGSARKFDSARDLINTILNGGDDRTLTLTDLIRFLTPLMRNRDFIYQIKKARGILDTDDYPEIIIGIYENIGNTEDEMVTEGKYLSAKLVNSNGKLNVRMEIVTTKTEIDENGEEKNIETRKEVNLFDRKTNFFRACGIRSGSEFAIVLDFIKDEDEVGTSDEVTGEDSIDIEEEVSSDNQETVSTAATEPEPKIIEENRDAEKTHKKKKVRGVRRPKQKKRDTVEGRKARLREIEVKDFSERLDSLIKFLDSQKDGDIALKNRRSNSVKILDLFSHMHGKQLDATLFKLIENDRLRYHKLLIALAGILIMTIDDFATDDNKHTHKILRKAKLLANMALSHNSSNLISTEGATFIGQKSDRPLISYIITLFRDKFSKLARYDVDDKMIDPTDLYNILHLIIPEAKTFIGTTLDIGGGTTFQEPESLFTFVNRTLGQEYISLDPMYSEETVPWSRKVEGKLVEISSLGESVKSKLIAGYAQNIPLPSCSIDRAISVWAFDKFNEKTFGTEQALREVARVLKNGSEFRVHGIRESQLDSRVLENYFEVEFKSTTVEKSYGVKSETLYFLKLRKKKLTDEQQATLEQESADWKIKYLT